MSQGPFDPGVIRQWESRVRRMVNQGRTREEIIYALTDANWPFDQADQLVRRTASRERLKAGGMMAGFGLLAALPLTVTYLSLTSSNGGVIWFPIFSLGGFFYGLVRLIRVRA